MRGKMIRVIAWREFRDLSRDRRTMLIILGLPILLYPVFFLVGLLFALTLLDQKINVGIVGAEELPTLKTHPEALVLGGGYLGECARIWDNPPLLHGDHFISRYARSETDFSSPLVQLIPEYDSLLTSHQIDVAILIPPNFQKQIEKREIPKIELKGREGDEISKLAMKRMQTILGRWQEDWKQVRFARMGLPPQIDVVMDVVDPEEQKALPKRTADELRDSMIKFLPFLLVMWTLAGALHPAIDLTAGEKERGTIETLLISPVERYEMVIGKLLTTFAFSYLSAIWNLLWMMGGVFLLSTLLHSAIISIAGLAWCSLLALPLAMLFSAVGLALGIFARSSKEGQYYLMPLFLVTMPLVLLTLTPGLKIAFWHTLLPVTAICLLQQHLLAISSESIPWYFWLSSMLSMLFWIALAIRATRSQFARESILFRDSEGLTWFRWKRFWART